MRGDAGVSEFARGGDWPERRGQVDTYQDVLRRGQTRQGHCLAAPEYAYCVCAAARLPPFGKALGRISQRVHPGMCVRCVSCVCVCTCVMCVCRVCACVYPPTKELMNGAKCVAVPEHAYCLCAAARFGKHVESSPRDGRGP